MCVCVCCTKYHGKFSKKPNGCFDTTQMGQVGTETKCVSVCVCVLVHVCVTERERGGELRAHRMGVREGGRCREWHQ